MTQILTSQDLRMLYTATVLRDRRYEPDRRHHIAYPRGGRRAADTLMVATYRRSVAHSDPFRWQRRVLGAFASLGLPILLAAAVVVVARGIVGMLR